MYFYGSKNYIKFNIVFQQRFLFYKKNPLCDKYNEILELLSGIKEYDVEFVDKVKINQVGYYTKKLNDDVNIVNDIKLIKDYSIGIKEFKCLTWEDKLEKVKEYIDLNHKRPNILDKSEEIKKLGRWTVSQNKNYKKRKEIMKNENIRKIWYEFINSDKYKKYFMSNEEEWKNILKKVEEYIDVNNKKPSVHDDDENIKKLSNWLYVQNQNYRKCKEIMKDENIRQIWHTFITSDKYSTYFMSNEEIWTNNYNELQKYIDLNDKLPSKNNNDDNIKKIGKWLQHQQENYKKNVQIMSDIKFRTQWKNFVNSEKYKIYFFSNEEIWKCNLEEVKKYIDLNNNKPSEKDDSNRIKQLGNWLLCQSTNYNKKKNIMKNEFIRKEWNDFVNSDKYKKYFLSNEEIWINNLLEVKNYINKHNKRPNPYDKSNQKNKMLGRWIKTQIANYKNQSYIMKENNIKKLWEDFINSDLYKNILIND